MSFKNLLGDKITDGSGKTVDPDSILSKADGVLVYFSAHWCPPCRQFTPQLVKSVKVMKEKGKKVEAVFVSSDQDEKAYKGYFAEMEGFYSVPYVDRDRKNKLSGLYKVSGIPTLIVLNNKAEIITKNGREAVYRDQEGRNFPWIPPTFKDVIGTKFVAKTSKGTEEVGVDKLQGKTVGVYFSAHWCGPCRQFTPELIKTYNKVVSDKKPFEIIFVSSDRGETDFNSYYGDMPWMAIPYSDSARREALSEYFAVEGIPTFVIMDFDTGKTIQSEGRMAISMDPQGKEFPWTPKPVNELNRMVAGSLNDTAALIVFIPSDASADEEKKIMGALEPLAKEVMSAAADELNFYVAKKDVVVSRVKQLFGKSSKTLLVGILDIPRGGVFVADKLTKTTDITDASIRAFYKLYKDGSLKSSPISGEEEEEGEEGN